MIVTADLFVVDADLYNLPSLNLLEYTTLCKCNVVIGIIYRVQEKQRFVVI